MKFKKLNESYTSDDLYQELTDYIYDELEYAVDNLAIRAASDIEDYDPDYCAETVNDTSMRAGNYLRLAAEMYAQFLLENAPEIIHEDVNDFYKNEPSEDFDASKFIGKPLKDFLRTIDHRTKINVSSENGFDTNGGYGNTAGMSGLAHDAGWYLADKKITDIKVPQDKRFYNYSIFIENLEDNDEDGWGEDINDTLYDIFNNTEELMYEIRNCVRGSYADFGDTVPDLVHKLRSISSEFEAAASQLEDQSKELQESNNASQFKKGQKVLYNGKETFIKEIDNDPEYGIDLLIKNPDWDGKDERFEYLWVADKVEVI